MSELRTVCVVILIFLAVPGGTIGSFFSGAARVAGMYGVRGGGVGGGVIGGGDWVNAVLCCWTVLALDAGL